MFKKVMISYQVLKSIKLKKHLNSYPVCAIIKNAIVVTMNRENEIIRNGFNVKSVKSSHKEGTTVITSKEKIEKSKYRYSLFFRNICFYCYSKFCFFNAIDYCLEI